MEVYIIGFVVVFALFLFPKFKGRHLEEHTYKYMAYEPTDVNYLTSQEMTTNRGKKGFFNTIHNVIFSIIFIILFILISVEAYRIYGLNGVLIMIPFILAGVTFSVFSIISLVKLLNN